MVIEYADLECPYCAQAHLILKELPVRRVFRHFPVISKHPRARVLAAAAEAAGLQGRFWEMHDSLLEDQGHLDDPHLWRRARRLGLDLDRFEADRRSDALAAAGGARLPQRHPRRCDDHPDAVPERPRPPRRAGRHVSRSAADPLLAFDGFAKERMKAMPPTGGG